MKERSRGSESDFPKFIWTLNVGFIMDETIKLIQDIGKCLLKSDFKSRRLFKNILEQQHFLIVFILLITEWGLEIRQVTVARPATSYIQNEHSLNKKLIRPKLSRWWRLSEVLNGGRMLEINNMGGLVFFYMKPVRSNEVLYSRHPWYKLSETDTKS